MKNFATNARKELIEKVKTKAFKIGITEENIKKAQFESSDAIYIDGKQLSAIEKKQREKLISRIKEIGYKQVVEEVAYTWFNRFTALRFMEVNHYIPSKVRVLSSSNSDSSEPDIIKEALTVDLDIDKEQVYEMKLNNKTEELFKYLIIKQCNSLNKVLPFMFETIDDYKEILFPDGLLSKESFLRDMTDITIIPEISWEKVEIIGWLYQYYIAEEKGRVIQAKSKYKTEEIPFATQLFTPAWIVRYMVQNTLGRYWVESHPEHKELIKAWELYLENPSNDPNKEEIFPKYSHRELKVEDIKCFDPAMGSGHILVYVFDVLFEIYSKCGYVDREIPKLIIENNLYGLDIDDRAYQLACFSVVMKALQYNKRFLRTIEKEGLKLNLASIQETNHFEEQDIRLIAGEDKGSRYETIKSFINQFNNAKTYGSLVRVQNFDSAFLNQRLNELQENAVESIFEEISKQKIVEFLPELLKQSEIMQGVYDVLISNPPYMGSRYMNSDLSIFLKNNYSFNSDLFSVFMEYSFEKVKEDGQLGFITPFVWMFLSSYENIRKRIVSEKSISSLIQLEYNSFEAAVVPVCTFTLRNYPSDGPGEFIRLSEFTGVDNQFVKTLEAVQNPNVSYRYTKSNKFYNDIPSQPIAYWISDQLAYSFKNQPKLLEYIDVTGSQNKTADNEKYLRRIWEVESNEINKKWCIYTKGGNYRKWYGNIEYVVDWSVEAKEFYKNNKTSNLLNERYWFRKGLTYNGISNRGFSVRIARDAIYDMKGPTFHVLDDEIEGYMIGLLNSKVANYIMDLFNPTMSYQMKDVNNIPVIIAKNPEVIKKVDELSKDCIRISKNDWGSKETSLEFDKHPILTHKGEQGTIEKALISWNQYSNEMINRFKQNEELLNEIFIELYGLQDEMNAIVNEEDITISKYSEENGVKSFISYAVGCIFGRYSLDEKGIVYAGGNFEENKYIAFNVDKDNIVPFVSNSYSKKHIVSYFIEFVKISLGEGTVTQNIEYIARILGKKNSETAKEAISRYFLIDFYKDHVQAYKSKPIYWLFTSGKQKAFNCLIYMHRYDKSTLSKIRTDYLHELQIGMDTEKKALLDVVNSDGTTKEIANAKKELKSLDLKMEELRVYDEKLHHMADMQIEIDLDDGIAVNYTKFDGLLAPIK